MVDKYALDSSRVINVFLKNGKYYGHIIKAKTDKQPATLMFETARYDTLSLLLIDFPRIDEVQ